MLKDLIIKLIRLYQVYISPYKTTKCPYCPTCSAYGIEAVNKHGAFKTVEDLLNVKGIGQAKLNKMRGQIIIK